jgi:uncharacterized protein (DUF1800 family)
MFAYLNRFGFSFFLCLMVLLGCGSGVLQASGASPAIAVAVAGASVVTISTPAQYAASLTGTSVTGVSWSIKGTSSSENYGSISASGVYTPPAVVPVHNVISIVATSVADPTKSSVTAVTILNPVPVVSSVSTTPGYHSTFLVNVKGSNFLPSSVILYGGYGVPTTYVSSTNLQFTLSSPPAAGTIVPLSVATPSPGKTVSANYSFAVPATVAVSVTGPTQSTVSTAAQFTAAVTGTTNQSVTWSVSGASASENYGTISASGLYMPPATVPAHNGIVITATSVVDTTKSASITTVLSAAVPAISSATLTAEAKSTFLVDIKGSNFVPTSYVQYLGYGVPTTFVSGNEVQFTLTSPPAAGSSISFSVVTPGTGKEQSAAYTAKVPSLVAVQASGDTTVAIGKTYQYAATVTGTTNTAVTWSLGVPSAAGNYGTISASGLYTPPSTVPVVNAITIIATSQQDPTKSSSVAVQLSNPVPAITSANLTLNGKGGYLVDVLGSNFAPASTVIDVYGVPTTFVSSSHLQFSIATPPAAGTLIPISVVTPAPGRTQSANFNITIPGSVAVSLTGATSVNLGQAVQYTASVTGTSNTAVTWAVKGVSASENYGTISATGLYTPPSTVPAHAGVTIVATSTADTTKSASLGVALLNAVPVISTATATPSGKYIALTITGRNFIPSTYLQFQGAGLATTYVSPTSLTATVTTAQTAGAQVPLVAISPNPGLVESASVLVQMPGKVGVSVMGAGQLAAGQTAQYAAVVTGTTNAAVTWSVTAANGVNPGTISSTGLYTPPATVTANLPVTIVATSQAQPASQGTATVTVTGVTASAAARLLDQSTFGPTDAMIAHVQTVGLSNFIDEQLAMPATLLPKQSSLPATCQSNAVICLDEYWWSDAVTAPDQLRQRVSMALTEMLVVSYEEANSAQVAWYSNIMTQDAFANWSTIMKDSTLSPAMGRYLNMANSGKPAPGAIANENFGRENMQLFNLGLYMLNQDGTLQTDGSGNPIPSYTEAQVEAFARVFTGWTYNMGTAATTVFPNWSGSAYLPMVAIESAHDTTSKVLLNTTLPAGQTAEQDLDAAIQDIFNHPNVGPFVVKQLIQHLVKSNPTPAYVGRIAAVFANDGTGVRGNMAAVIKALLLDPEARAGDTEETATDGYLREPILWTANILRALNAVPKPLYNDYTAYTAIDTFATSQGQKVFNSPTVFNFYPAEWALMNTGLNGPQFALETTATIMQKLTLSSNIVNNQLGRLTIDLSATGPLGTLAVASNQVLLQELSNLFMHGQMSAQMQTTILNAISSISDPAQRVRTAVYLVISSPQYRVVH